MTALFENFFLAASYALFMVQGFTLCTVYQFWKILLKFLAFYSIFRHQFTFEMSKYVNVLGLIEICSFRRGFYEKNKNQFVLRYRWIAIRRTYYTVNQDKIQQNVFGLIGKILSWSDKEQPVNSIICLRSWAQFFLVMFSLHCTLIF